MLLTIRIGGREFRAEIKQSGGNWHCRLDEHEFKVDIAQAGAETLSLLINGRSFEARRDKIGGNERIFINDTPYTITLADPRSLRNNRQWRAGEHGPQTIAASMPGKVVRLLAREGDPIQAGQGIVIIEAMKMQNELRSPGAGTLQKLMARQGANVNAGEILAIIAPLGQCPPP